MAMKLRHSETMVRVKMLKKKIKIYLCFRESQTTVVLVAV